MRLGLRALLAAAAILVAGLAIGWTLRGAVPVASEPRLACRPSAPATAVATAGAQVVLYLGNSIVFDHDWSLPGTRAVNCARQGLVAEALPVDALPRIAPDLVVLGFGTVELVRGARDAPAVVADLGGVLRGVAARYDGAPILILAVPPYEDGSVSEAVNAGLAALAADMGAGFAPLGPGARTYDGIHLVRDAYEPWHAAVRDALP